MATKFTDKSIQSIQPNPTKRQEIPDGLLPGLYFIVQQSGYKSWACRYRDKKTNKTIKLTIGTYPLISLAKAREEARKILQEVAEGVNPAKDKAQKKLQALDKTDTMEILLEQYMETNIRKNRKKKTGDEYSRIISKEITPHIGTTKIQDVSRSDILTLIDTITDRGAPILANRTLATLKSFFSWAKSRDKITISPAGGIKNPSKETSKNRILCAQEIVLFWQATDQLGWPFGPLFRLLLLTGQRRTEVGEMTWSEIQMDTSSQKWTMSGARTKNGREHTVPLTNGVLEILQPLQRSDDNNGYVFTTNGKTPVSGFSKAKKNLDQAIAQMSSQTIPTWTLHDLRRTAASLLAKLGHPIHVTEAILNHKSGTISGVAAVYNRYEYQDEKRKALEDLDNYIAKVTSKEIS
jgi:integrase